MKKLIFIYLFLLVFLSSPVLAANFYCDCTTPGGTGGAGSYADPFESFADIEAYASSPGFSTGDDIYFLEGATCSETGDLDIAWEGTSGNYSVFGCYDGDGDFDCDGTRPILQRSSGSTLIDYGDADGNEYLKFQDLQFKFTEAAPGTQGSQLISTGGTGNSNKGHLIFDNCYFSGANYAAIAFDGIGDYTVITNSEITHCGNGAYYGVSGSVDSSDHHLFANNTGSYINWNSEWEDGYTRDGHFISYRSCDYVIVENNTASYCRLPYDIFVVSGEDQTNVVFRNNTAIYSELVGIDLYAEDTSGASGSHNIYAYQNIIVESGNDDVAGARPAIRVNAISGSNGTYVFNNTIYNSSGGEWGLQARDAADYYEFFNNIVWTNGIGSDDDLIYHDPSGETMGSNQDIDYNLYWTASGDPSGETLWTDKDGTPYNWTNWKGTAGWDTNSPTPANPSFTDTDNFELESDSTAINAGKFLTTVNQTNGSGKSFTVANANILHHDYGITDADGNAIDGMLISLYDSNYGIQNTEITNISGSTITVASSVSWVQNTTSIALRMYGTAPDIGAQEFLQGSTFPGVTISYND